MLKPHLADVICQVADGIATIFFVTGGRCYCLVADVITIIGCVFGLIVCYRQME